MTLPLNSEIIFHTPGFRGYRTDAHDNQGAEEFISISVTGTTCALKCEHCNTKVLRGMTDLRRFDGSLYDLCESLAENGTRGALISGGSDPHGRVPLLPHIEDMKRVRSELGMAVRVHVGLPDEETCAALGEVDLDGAMIDIIGHRDTIKQVYHLDADPEDYEEALAWMEKYHVPMVPHIVMGLHYGKMLGEDRALEMIIRHPPKLLALVILMSMTRTAMAEITPPSLEEIGTFFKKTRAALPSTPVMLGCARPMGKMKEEIDRMAVDARFNGIAFPARGIVEYAQQAGMTPQFVNACCGVSW